MAKTTKHGGATNRWKEQGEDGSAREGAQEVKPDGVRGATTDPPRKSAGAGSRKKSAAKRVSERRDTAEDGT